MKFYEALKLVLEEEEGFEKVDKSKDLSDRFKKATIFLKKDVETVKDVVNNNKHINLSWKELSSLNYKDLLFELYNLKAGSEKLLQQRRIYDLNPEGPIAKELDRKYGVGNNLKMQAAKNAVEKYSSIYPLLKELTKLIREYNQKKLGTFMNIPSVEFKIPLREEINDSCY